MSLHMIRVVQYVRRVGKTSDGIQTIVRMNTVYAEVYKALDGEDEQALKLAIQHAREVFGNMDARRLLRR